MTISGVDLLEIDGIGGGVLTALMSEIGPRDNPPGSFASADRFCAWLGGVSVQPDQRRDDPGQRDAQDMQAWPGTCGWRPSAWRGPNAGWANTAGG